LKEKPDIVKRLDRYQQAPYRLKLLASSDKDFENIPGIQLYKPVDL
jgi:hypothetical protein